MASGNNTYGIIRPSLITSDDIEILYNYRPTRSAIDEEYREFKKVEDLSVFENATMETTDSNIDNVLPGIFNLKLPVSIFGRVGFYTIYIRPKEILCSIENIGTLSGFSSVKGIVINLSDLDDSVDKNIFQNDNLVGYRIEYFSSNTTSTLKREQFYRIVTSSNLCDTISGSNGNGNMTSQNYAYNVSGSLSFITVTPSVAPSFKQNALPYIGVPGQRIALCNTKFDPICIELEMTEHDIETLSTMLEGEQVRNLDNGRLTTYNSNGEIYHQSEFSTVKSSYTGQPIAEIKVNVGDNIDTSLDLETLKNS